MAKHFDTIVLVWVASMFFATLFFVTAVIVHLIRHKKIVLDKGALLLLSACLTALIMDVSAAPPVHHVYDDEVSYITQSVNILASGQAGLLLKGSLLAPDRLASWTSHNKFPGFGWLGAVVLFFTRDAQHIFFILNLFLGVLTVAVIYRIAWLLTASNAVAWWSAVFLACLPAHISYSLSGASDISASFFFLLGVLLMCEFRTLRKNIFIYAALFSGIYSVCIRPPYALWVLPGFLGVLYVYAHKGWLDKKISAKISVDALCLFVPIVCAYPFLLKTQADGETFAIPFILKSIHTSILYLFDFKQNAPLITLAALFTVIRNVLRKDGALTRWLVLWFLAGLLIINCSAGPIAYPGRSYSDRYLLFFVLPYVLLAAQGITELTSRPRLRFLAGLFFVIVVVNAVVASHGLLNMVKSEGYFTKTLLLRKMVAVIPDNAYVIDECADLVAVNTTKRAIQTRFFINGERPQEVVFLKGVSDFSDPARTDLVANILMVEYQCRPLVGSAYNEAELSAVPLYCKRKTQI